MPIAKKYLTDFNEYGIYHVYNRTNNYEDLFLCDENRLFFLKKYQEYLSPFLDTYCWSLLSNHFHFLIRIKPIASIQTSLQNIPYKELSNAERKFLTNNIHPGILIEQSFKRFFQSYALSFNNMYNRKGNLFYRPFKRVAVERESHFTQAIIYIHANAQKHKLVGDFTTYPWSSWNSILSEAPTKLLRKEVLEWFGNKLLFIKAHKELTKYYYNSDISIED